jgi:transposase
MEQASVQCVVGIDVAKQSHTVCALRAPSGAVVQKAWTIPASREGYRDLLRRLGQWAPAEAIVIGLESTGILWEPLYDALTQAGYQVLVLNPRQTASWSASLGLRAKTDGLDALTIAKGLLAGLARASVLPSETVQALRTLTRTRHDLVQAQSAARQRVQDEWVAVFPELPTHLPGKADLAAPGVLKLLGQYASAQAFAQVPLRTLTRVLGQVSAQRWGKAEAAALQTLAKESAASTRAVAARSVVVKTLAKHLLDLHERIAEVEAAISDLLKSDPDSQRLQEIPGIGPINAAVIRAELGDVQRFSGVDQVIAYAGLEPRTVQSGAYQGQHRLSKRGPGALRHALYLATLVAVRFRSEWRARYERLLARGRAKKEALTILSRTMLKVIFHLWRTSSPYDPAKLACLGA